AHLVPVRGEPARGQQRGLSLRAAVGWAKARLRRAHHLPSVPELVGTLRFAHPTKPSSTTAPVVHSRPSRDRSSAIPLAGSSATHSHDFPPSPAANPSVVRAGRRRPPRNHRWPKG